MHLILEDDKIRVEKVIGQYAIANLQGHSSRLDIYASKAGTKGQVLEV